jgi:hypothetical protein
MSEYTGPDIINYSRIAKWEFRAILKMVFKNYPKIDPWKPYGHPSTDLKVIQEETAMEHFKKMIQDHVDAEEETLPADFFEAGCSPVKFIQYWEKYDLNPFIENLKAETPDGLYEIFAEVKRLHGLSAQNPLQSIIEPEPEPNEEPQKDGILPAPIGTAWEDVTITLIARDTVSFKIGNQTERFTYAELGMSDKRTGDKPKFVWWFFVLLIKGNGFISRQTDNYDAKLPDSAKQFKGAMKKLSKIEDDIFAHYKTEGGYRAKFKAIDKTHGTYKEIISLPEA